jgi:hypothetical protein
LALSLAWSRDQLPSRFALVTLPIDQGYALEGLNFKVDGETAIVKLQSDRISMSKVPGLCHLLESLAVFFLASAFLFFPSNANAQAANIFIAQNATGAGTGGSCANALAVSFFNSSGNWGTGASQIGGGTTVHLCGTISSNLTFQQNGTSGKPVVLDGAGATMSAYINTGTQYWTIQNCVWSTSYATNSPTQAVIQTQGGAAFGTIQGNHIDVMNSAQVIFFQNITHDITVLNNYMRVSTPSGGDGFDTDVIDTEGAYNIMVQGNYIAMNVGAGDQNCGGCHDDLTQVWGSGGNPANAPYNWTYRYNYFAQESSPAKTNNQSLMMMEQIGTGYWNVYGNVFQCVSSGSSGNGITFDSNTSGMVANIYDNTIVENAGACNNLFNLSGSGVYNLENNIIYNTDAGNALTGGVAFGARGFNLWYGPNIPSCVATEICGQNPLFTNYGGSQFSLQSGSPAIGIGTNLGSTYDQYPVSAATWPNPQLGTRSGAWDLGAYSSGGGASQPTPPSGLTATVTN